MSNVKNFLKVIKPTKPNETWFAYVEFYPPGNTTLDRAFAEGSTEKIARDELQKLMKEA